MACVTLKSEYSHSMKNMTHEFLQWLVHIYYIKTENISSSFTLFYKQ